MLTPVKREHTETGVVMVDGCKNSPQGGSNDHKEAEEIRRRTPEEQAAILKATGPNARQARRQAKLEQNGMRRNTFVYPAHFDELVKEIFQFLRDHSDKQIGEFRVKLTDGGEG